MAEHCGGVQGQSECGEGYLVLNERRSQGKPGHQRDPCCLATVEMAPLMHRQRFLGGTGNPCCAQSALLGS